MRGRSVCGCRRSTHSTASLRKLAAISLGLLSGGIVLGLARLRSGEFDAAMAVTLGLWLLVATVLALRWEIGLRGKRAATLLTVVFALVAVVLPITHFAS